MKHAISLLLGAIAIVVVLSFTGALYVVNEVEQVVLTQFGRPVGAPVTTPGVHFKTPFVQKVNHFDKRFLEWDGDANQVPTRDKKFIWVDTYARWRIADALRFYQAVQNERGGQSRLDDIVDGETRNAIASFDLIEIVRSSDREFQLTGELEGIMTAEAVAEITSGREVITQQILKLSSAITPEFGVELVDVRFKRINYTESVQQAVFQRMITERKRIAERSRSEGQGRAAEILGQKERDVLAATSVGYRTAEELKGKADATATDVYARAYGRDPSFYEFFKSMETLKASLGKDATVILSTDSDLLRFMKGSRR